MRDDKYWEEASVNTIIMGEKIVLNYEKELDSLYISLSSDLEKELSFIFSKYNKNGKILYNDLRTRLDNSSYKKFKSQLKTIYNELEENMFTKDIIQEAKKLYDRKTATVLEYIQFMSNYYIAMLATNNAKEIYNTMEDIYLASYYVYFYNFINGVQKDVEFVPIQTMDMQNNLKGKWFDGTRNSTYMERVDTSRLQSVSNITDMIPRFIAMGYTLDRCVSEIDKYINKRQNYDKAIVRTTADYTSNQAMFSVLDAVDLDSYVYIAVLDNRTTEQCRNLDGTVYKLSQAVVGVNLPPLHHNCRSTIGPHFSTSDKNRFNELDSISRKNTLNSWLDKVLKVEHADIRRIIQTYF